MNPHETLNAALTDRPAVWTSASPEAAPAVARGVRGLTSLTGLLASTALTSTSAVLYALAQPPLDLWQASWIALVPLLLAIRSCRSASGAAFCGLGFALLFSALVAGWLPGTVAVFFQLHAVTGWLAALAVYLLFAALPLAFFGALAHGILQRGSRCVVLAGIPALWVATELLRARLAGGLPWALLGHALHGATLLIQIADVAGVFGVSALLATVNVAAFVWIRGRAREHASLVVAGSVVAAVALYGHARLLELGHQLPRAQATVGVLQPNQAPVYHWTPLAAERALTSYVRLTQQAFGTRRPDLVIWPENAIPLYPAQDPATGARLARLAKQLGAPLVLGAPAIAGPDPGTQYNAAHLVLPDAGPAATYLKQRLVPFAEYPPLGAKPAGSDEDSGFGAGAGPVGFDAAGLRWGPTICLDLIYPEVVRATVLAGAEVLINLSNDSWLAAGGRGAAAQQFAQAVFRAVENRRDVVRAATTGISTVVSASGVPQEMLAEGAAGSFVAPVSARTTLSVYTRIGDVFATCCAALAAALVVFQASRRRAAVAS